MYIRISVCNFVYSRDLGAQLWTIFDDDRHVQLLNNEFLTPLRERGYCRWDVSAFDLRRSMRRLSMIDVSTFKDRYVALRRSCDALRRSMSRCVDLRRSMCRLSKIDVSTFGDGCVDLRRPMIDVSTFEDR